MGCNVGDDGGLAPDISRYMYCPFVMSKLIASVDCSDVISQS